MDIRFHLDKTVTMHKMRYFQLNPVAHWALTVCRVMKIKSFSVEWLINFIERNGTIGCISSTEIRSLIWAAVQAYGGDELGFKAKEAGGTHSNRSGGRNGHVFSRSASLHYHAYILDVGVLMHFFATIEN
eukprot:3116851-Ditylum_brightwellii.AAC.2